MSDALMRVKDKIEELRLRNFLSLRDVALELGKLNVFIGPNASGKSNIARALQLLSHHARGDLPLLPNYDSFKEIVYNFDPMESVELSVRVVIDARRIIYRLSLTSEDYVEEAYVNERNVLSSMGSRPNAGVVAQEGDYRYWNKPHSPFPYFERSLPHRSALASMPAYASKDLHKLASLLKGIRVYSFAPERIRASCPIGAAPILRYHGDNLARFLLHLFLEDRRAFNELEQAFMSCVPEVMEIIPHIEGGEVEVWLRVKELSEPLRPANISDGSLRLLAYIAALYSGGSLVVFEEPENNIHPHLLETIIDLARKAPCQVIITTHSPYLLDHVKPEEVYVVKKVDAETRVKKLSETSEIDSVKTLLEEGGTLGEAWYSGMLGSNPT